jgi:anti-anti-sigma regulatory factor
MCAFCDLVRRLLYHLRWVNLQMMRISVVRTSSQAVTLRLEGEVKGGWVAELRQSCEGVLSEGSELALDLAGVSFINQDGIALIHTLQDRDVILRNPSPFVAELLGASNDNGHTGK